MPFRTHQVLGSVGMRESVGLRGAEDRLGVNCFIFHIHMIGPILCLSLVPIMLWLMKPSDPQVKRGRLLLRKEGINQSTYCLAVWLSGLAASGS